MTPITSTLGGMLIGLAAAMMWSGNGRIAGISGIVSSGVLSDGAWERTFLVGMVVTGMLSVWVLPAAFESTTNTSMPALMLAGLLVGIGTRLGRGCTSGHGICGLGRLSPRSAVAVGVFMSAAAIVANAVSA